MNYLDSLGNSRATYETNFPAGKWIFTKGGISVASRTDI